MSKGFHVLAVQDQCLSCTCGALNMQMQVASGRRKELERAKAALEVEGRGLAQSLKRKMSDADRERVLQVCGVGRA